MLNLILTPLLAPVAFPAPQAGQASVLHHPEAIVYFEMADVQSVYREYGSTAYALALADPQIREAMEKFLNLEEGGFDNPAEHMHRGLDWATEGIWGQLHPNLTQLKSVSFSYHLEGTTPAKLQSMKDEDGDLDYDRLFEGLQNHSRVLLVVDFTAESYAEATFDLFQGFAREGLEAPGLKATKMTLGSQSGRQVFFPELPELEVPGGMAQVGNRLALVLGQEPQSYLNQRIAAENAVSSEVRFADGHKRFETSQGTTVFELRSQLAQAFYGICPDPEYIIPVVDLVASTFGPDFDMLLRGGQWRVQLRPSTEGAIFVTESFQKDLKLGPFDDLFSAHLLTPDSLAVAGDDAIVGGAMTVDPDILVALLKHVIEDTGEDPFKEWEDTYGFRPEADILQHLGTTWVSTLPISAIGITSLPGISYWIDLRDKDAFIQGMSKLQSVVIGEADGEFELRHKRFRGNEVFTFKSPDLRDELPVDISPTVVVFDERVLVTLSARHARVEIKRMRAARSERKTHPYLRPETLMELGDVIEIAYSDWAKVLGRLYSSAQSFMPMFLGSPEDMDLPVDIRAMPDADLFTPFFSPTKRHRTRVEGGIQSRCESSVGPEFSGIIAVGMAGGTMALLPMMFLGATSVEEVGPIREPQKVTPVPKRKD